MRGRKPKPPHLRAIDGGAAKRPESAGGDRTQPAGFIAPEIPPMPGAVEDNPDAREEWERLAPQMEAAGLLCGLYRGIFTNYCIAWGTLVSAERQIRQLARGGGDGMIVKSPKGYPIQSPYLAIRNRAMEQLHKYSAELGITPTALARAERGAQGDLFDDFGAFIDGRGA